MRILLEGPLIADSSSVALSKLPRFRNDYDVTGQSSIISSAYVMMNAAGAIRRQPLFACWLAVLTRQLYNLLISETLHYSAIVFEELPSIVSLTSVIDTNISCEHDGPSMTWPHSTASQVRTGFHVGDRQTFSLSLLFSKADHLGPRLADMKVAHM
jgi:hypothetical protein